MSLFIYLLRQKTNSSTNHDRNRTMTAQQEARKKLKAYTTLAIVPVSHFGQKFKCHTDLDKFAVDNIVLVQNPKTKTVCFGLQTLFLVYSALFCYLM